MSNLQIVYNFAKIKKYFDNVTIKILTENNMELTILMPCLNEAETLKTCILKAKKSLAENKIEGEVLIADNGSTDGSQLIAQENGARVVNVSEKGYGNALRGGIKAAYGRYIIMGDADDSYDFSNLLPFVQQLRGGNDLVMGNRFKGGIEKGAMPFLHKYLGNPVLSFLGRLFFNIPIGDFHCGLRGFSKEASERMGLRTTGMEFASEMVVKASLFKMKITEVPTTLKKDGRSHPPHLNTWRDGWRHLRFLLMYSPAWLFLYPGIFLILIGIIFSSILIVHPIEFQNIVFDVHTLLYASSFIILGFQSVVFYMFTKTFAINENLHPSNMRFEKLLKLFSLENGLIAGVLLLLAGLLLTSNALFFWNSVHFTDLNPQEMLRQVIPAVTAIILGMQLIFYSFMQSILSLKRK